MGNDVGVRKPRRRAIPAAIRAAVVLRDGLNCRHCGREIDPTSPTKPYRPDSLHLDHAIPWAEGGEDTVENLVVSCAGCNLSRPRPLGLGRRRIVKWRQDGDDYYWQDQAYRPPKRITYHHPRAFYVDEAAEILGIPGAHVIAAVVLGEYGGTTGAQRPIRVTLPRPLDNYVGSRLAELGWP